MELKIFENYHSMSATAARMILEKVKQKPGALFCFATGDTPRLTYRMLAEEMLNKNIDFSKAFLIGLDEWLGIPPENSGSCHYFLHHHLFGPMRIPSSSIHLFKAMTTDFDKECETMNNIIEQKGGVDLMLVGVGMNGHIGFNEPGTDINSLAHVAELKEMTKSVGQKYFTESVIIKKGLTLGLRQVMQAKTLVMLANGERKAPIIKKAVEGNISNKVPASLIRNHKDSYLMLDKEAASELNKSLIGTHKSHTKR